MDGDCPTCQHNRQLAARLQQIADMLLIAPSRVTGIPAPAVRAFVEGMTTGAVELGKAHGPHHRARAGQVKKRAVSAYNRKYKAAFKKVAPKYKLKSGKWRNGGFKKAVKEAHRVARGGMRR